MTIILLVWAYLLIGVAIVAVIESVSDHIIETESGPVTVGVAAVLWPLTLTVVFLILVGWLVREASDALDDRRKS